MENVGIYPGRHGHWRVHLFVYKENYQRISASKTIYRNNLLNDILDIHIVSVDSLKYYRSIITFSVKTHAKIDQKTFEGTYLPKPKLCKTSQVQVLEC